MSTCVCSTVDSCGICKWKRERRWHRLSQCIPETDREQTPELLGHRAPSATPSFKMPFLVLVEALTHTSAGTSGPLPASPRSATHQDVGGSEEVAEGVVEEVDEGGCIEISIAHHLAGKQGLPRAAAEEAPHHPVAHVHVVGHFLEAKSRLDPGPSRQQRGAAAALEHTEGWGLHEICKNLQQGFLRSCPAASERSPASAKRGEGSSRLRASTCPRLVAQGWQIQRPQTHQAPILQQ